MGRMPSSNSVSQPKFHGTDLVLRGSLSYKIFHEFKKQPSFAIEREVLEKASSVKLARVGGILGRIIWKIVFFRVVAHDMKVENLYD